MTDGLLLGIDLGTTHAKAAVITLDGQERSHGVVPTPWRTVSTGAEMDPGDLVGAGVVAAREAIDGGPDGQVLGVGVTSMAETGTLLDRRGEPVAPMIAWHDARGDHQARELAEAFGEIEPGSLPADCARSASIGGCGPIWPSPDGACGG
ncbi:MAG: FGGY family carbohydrate kinase [Actinomycetota bacterium]